MPFFGILLHGRSVLLYYALSYLLLLLAAIGLMKNQIWGYWLALGFQLFSFLNMCANFLLPGRTERFDEFISGMLNVLPFAMQVQIADFMKSTMIASLASGMLFSLVILGFLWSCRKRFFEFARLQARSAANV